MHRGRTIITTVLPLSLSTQLVNAFLDLINQIFKLVTLLFPSSFYSNPDLRNVRSPADPQPTIDVALLIQQLQNSPELATALAALLPHTS